MITHSSEDEENRVALEFGYRPLSTCLELAEGLFHAFLATTETEYCAFSSMQRNSLVYARVLAERKLIPLRKKQGETLEF